MAQVIAARGRATTDSKVGAKAQSERFRLLSATHENQVGELQSLSWKHPPQYGISKKAEGFTGVRHRA
ncbi:hypothetical protein D3C84_1206020 [compost metagenome]